MLVTVSDHAPVASYLVTNLPALIGVRRNLSSNSHLSFLSVCKRSPNLCSVRESAIVHNRVEAQREGLLQARGIGIGVADFSIARGVVLVAIT